MQTADHPIRLEPATRRWRAYFNHHVIADTDDALILREANLPPVVYFPRKDVSMEFMGRTNHQTHCPYKGDAAYYTIEAGGRAVENAVWTYETPFPGVADIAGYLAFYPNKVEITEDKAK